MKKIIAAAVAGSVALLAGCAMTPYQPGIYYTQQKTPVVAPNNAMSCAKRGSATVTNILGAFAFGDASVATAKKSAGINKIDSVDVNHSSILGIYSTTTTEVCGE